MSAENEPTRNVPDNGNPLDSPQFKAFVSATRDRTAAGLDRMGDFAHKQARRLSPTGR